MDTHEIHCLLRNEIDQAMHCNAMLRCSYTLTTLNEMTESIIIKKLIMI